MKVKKIIVFGAGNIGRSFIGQLFNTGGYMVVFVDVNKEIINEMNKRGNYNVVIKSEYVSEVINVRNIKGIYAGNKKQVSEELIDSEIAAISVGTNNLKNVIPLLANGLIERKKKNIRQPLDIIIAENMRNAAYYLGRELAKHLPINFPLNEMVGLVETSIGKMVPIMTKEDLEKDILQVFAEPYNTLIVDKKGFKNPVPDINGLEPKENMKTWVDRKLFIHNLGHSAAAFSGHFKYLNAVYMYEVLSDLKVLNFTREVMDQSADALLIVYKDDFTLLDLREYIEDLLMRFRNKALKDTIYRIGRDLVRKLGYDDRFVGAIHIARKAGKPYNKIIKAMSYGL